MRSHTEHQRSDRIGWLRAAVLGANDGIVSTAGLVQGVAAAGAEHRTLPCLVQWPELELALGWKETHVLQQW